MTTMYLNLRFKIGGILVSEVGPVYVRGRTEYVENVNEDHLSFPELAYYAMSFRISELGKTYAVPIQILNKIFLFCILLFFKGCMYMLI